MAIRPSAQPFVPDTTDPTRSAQAADERATAARAGLMVDLRRAAVLLE